MCVATLFRFGNFYIQLYQANHAIGGLGEVIQNFVQGIYQCTTDTEIILTDKEIAPVLLYIKHSWPEEKRSWQEDLNSNPKVNFKPIEKQSNFRISYSVTIKLLQNSERIFSQCAYKYLL